MKIFDLKKKILFEIPDQKTVLQATLKSEFSKNFLHVNKHPKYFKKNQSDKIHRQIWTYSR